MNYFQKLWVNKRKLRNCTIIFGVIGVLLIIAGIVVPIAINAVIHNQVSSQIMMTNSNSGMWADIPGDTKAFIVRNFTFFQFENPNQFMYKQQTPVVKESKVYSYQESAQFVNTEFLDGGDLVKFNFYRHFNNLYDTKNEELVNTLNLGAFGAWNIMKNTNLTNLNLNGFYSLFYSMNNTILPTIINLALSSFIYDVGKDISIPSTQAKQFCKAGGINPNGDLCNMLWNDEQYGWVQNSTRIHWVIAQNDEYTSSNNEKFALIDYFKLSQVQFYGIITSFSAICKTYQSVIEAYYSVLEQYGLPQDSFSLAAMQWSQAYVSLHPQGNLSSFDSLTQLNQTLFYMPEIKNYRDTVFFEQYPYLKTEYYNVELPFDWARKVFFYTDYAKTKTFTKNKSSMLNLGNLEFLWINGLNYDNSTNVQFLNNIAKRFEIIEDQSDYSFTGVPKKTFLFWNYIKYFAYNFTMNGATGGNSGQAAIGQFASNSLQQNFQEMKNRMPVKIKSAILQKSIKTGPYKTCIEYMSQGLFYQGSTELILTQEQATTFCNIPQYGDWSIPKTFENIFDLYVAFRDLVGPEFDFVADFEEQTNFTDRLASSIFLTSTLTDAVLNAESLLFQQFQCQSDSEQIQRCSDLELAVKQWSSSEVTRNIDETIQDLYQKSDSYYFWAMNKDEIYAPFEYYYFAKNVYQSTEDQIQKFEMNQLLNLLNYDNLFSLTIIPLAFKMNLQGDHEGIKKQFFFDDGLMLVNYIRYIMIEISLYSSVQTRELQDLLFGYTDPFVYSQNTKDPQQGGNPALNYTVMLNDPNMTSPANTLDFQVMYTGKGSIEDTRQYQSINGSTYVTYYYTWFDGENVIDTLASPWEENVPIQGSDSVQNPPSLDEDSKINVFVTTFFRGGSAVTTGETHNHGGLECYRFANQKSFYMSGEEYPPNYVFDSNVYYGLQNMTKVKMAPIFVTNRHLMDSDSRIINSVIMLDENGIQVVGSEYDGLFMDVEPYSGLTLAAALNAQANILVQPDDLFNITQDTLLPVFNTFRTGNWTDASIDDYLGELKMALVAKKAILISCVVLGGLLLILGIVFFYRFIVLRKLNSSFKEKEEAKLEEHENENEIEQKLVSENYI